MSLQGLPSFLSSSFYRPSLQKHDCHGSRVGNGVGRIAAHQNPLLRTLIFRHDYQKWTVLLISVVECVPVKLAFKCLLYGALSCCTNLPPCARDRKVEPRDKRLDGQYTFLKCGNGDPIRFWQVCMLRLGFYRMSPRSSPPPVVNPTANRTLLDGRKKRQL